MPITALPQAAPDDVVYLDSQGAPTSPVDLEIQQRIIIERAIVRKACEDLLAAGFKLRVEDGEGWACERTDDLATVMSSIMSTDEDNIHVFGTVSLPGGESGTRHLGWVQFVYGNTGWDVIADNTLSIEEHLTGATKLAEEIEELM